MVCAVPIVRKGYTYSRNTWNKLGRRPERKRPLGKPRRRWDVYIKIKRK